MSKKENTQVEVKEQPKAVGKKISNYVVGVGGNLRKTTLAIMKTELMRYTFEQADPSGMTPYNGGKPNGNQLAVFLTDHRHQELAKVHGTKENGDDVPVDSDNPLTGVGYFNFRQEKKQITNNLQRYMRVDLLQDNPADSVDSINPLSNMQEFIDLHKKINKPLVYTISLIDDKSFSSLKAIYELFIGCEVSNVFFEIVIFSGSLKNEDEGKGAIYNNFLKLYNSNPYVKGLKATGQVSEHFIEKVIDRQVGEDYLKKMRFPKLVELNANFELDFSDFLNIEGMYEEYKVQWEKFLDYVRTASNKPVFLKEAAE